MSVEKDSDEKVDVESPPTPRPPFLTPNSPPPFLPPPPTSIKPESDNQSSLESLDVSKATQEMAASRRSGDLTLPPQHPFLPSHSYPPAIPPSSPLHYHYLYYSHMMSPYLLGRSPPLPHPPPLGHPSPIDKAAVAAAAAREMYTTYSPYLRSPTSHHSPLPTSTPARPAPLHPYYSFPTQLPAHL